MAQSSYTPILIYGSTTTGNTPLAANLTTSASGVELAVNAADGKLFYKDSGGVVQVLASKAGNINVASFQTSLGGLTPSTATTGIVTLAGTLNTTSGGTGLTSFTAGDLPYYAAGTLLSKLSIGTTGQILTSSGTAPQWSTLSGVAVTTFSAGTTGFTPSSATSGAVTLAGTLATTNGGTGLTSFTANGVVYASSTSALATGSALTFDGSNLGIGTSSPTSFGSYKFLTIQGANTANGGALELRNSDNTLNAQIYVGNSTMVIQATSNVPMLFNTNGIEQMRLTSTGLVLGNSSAISGGKISALVDLTAVNGLVIRDSATTYANNDNYVLLQNSTGATAGGLTHPASASLGVWGNDDIRFLQGSGSAEQARLTSTGLGIGTSSPAIKLDVSYADTAYNPGIRVTNTANSSASQAKVYAVNNAGDYISLGRNSTILGGQSAIFATGAFPLEFYTNSTKQATIDSAGNFGLGVTPSAWAGVKAIQLAGSSAIVSSDQYLDINTNAYWGSTSQYRYISATGSAAQYLQAAGAHVWKTGPASTGAGNLITFTQAATLTASGNYLLGVTSDLSGTPKMSIAFDQSSGYGITLKNTNSGNNTNFIYFINSANGGAGSISQNGATGVLYNITSDYRLKDIAGPVTTSGAFIDSLKPVQGSWKADGSRFIGFLAHELQEASETVVGTGVKDGEEMQSIDYSNAELIANFAAEIQSLRKRLAAAGIA